jgi:type IV secretion system protein TrbJ
MDIMKILRLTFPIAAVILCLAPSAHAVSEFAGSTWPEQVVQEITATEQYAKQATEVATQLQQLENQVINMEQLPTQTWASVQNNLQQLVDVVQAANGISYASQNALAQMQQTYGDPGQLASNQSQSIGQWRTSFNSQVGSALKAIGLSLSDFQTRQQALHQIESLSQTSTGRMQAIQAGNQIAGMTVNQLQLLRQQLATAQSVQMQYQATQMNTQAQEQNQVEQFIKNSATTPDLF